MTGKFYKNACLVYLFTTPHTVLWLNNQNRIHQDYYSGIVTKPFCNYGHETAESWICKFTWKEKLSILKVAKQRSVKDILEKYDFISFNILLLEEKVLRLKDQEMRMRALEKENDQL